MMQTVHMTNSERQRTRGVQQGNDSFRQQIGLTVKEEINEMLHLDHSFLWC